MQKKAGKIYFIDKELTDAEVDEGYVYPVWFVVSETIIDEAGEPYEISKHIIYNRNGIKSIFTGSGGGGGGSDTLEDVRGRDNTIKGDINVSAATTYFSLYQSNPLFQSEYSFDGGIAYVETYDVTNNTRSSLRLNGNSVVVDSNATNSPGIIGNKDFSLSYNDNSFIQRKYFLNNRNKYVVTTADSTPNKTWTDGVDLWFTNNLGVNSKMTDNRAFKSERITGNTSVFITGTVTLKRNTELVVTGEINGNSIFTIALATPEPNEVNEYIFVFKTFSTVPPVITHPMDVKWRGKAPVISTGRTWTIVYEQVYNGTTYEILGTAIETTT